MKNKRQFAFCTKRTVFVALFLVGVLISSAVTTFILNANAQLVPVRSVEIVSENSSFENNDRGAWKIEKSAEWIGYGKARITFNVNSIIKYDGTKKLDVVMVVDNSGSMVGDKIAQVKTDAIDLANTLLTDQANQIALVAFNSTASVLSNFTNSKDEITAKINQLGIDGCTNYYDGFLKAEEILEGYVKQDGRELVLLFLTDGYPNEQTPNEVAEYHTIKTKYPYIVVNGIQYEMGDTILQPIIDISDNQFIADMSSLNNVLFEATITPYVYDDFVITDYIDDTYWTVAGLDAISATLGGIGLEYDGSTPKVVWDMSGLYRSGQTATLTIEVNLKEEFRDRTDLLLPTNKHEEIETEIPGTPDEDIDSPKTPILKEAYDVIYYDNKPTDCELSGTIPATESHTVFTPVALSEDKLSCQNYEFKGWRVSTKVEIINDSYFRMPGEDVHVVAVWAKLSISKSMDGTIHTRKPATLTYGSTVNTKMKVLAGKTNPNTYTEDDSITAIMRANELPIAVDINDSKYIISASNSALPIYAWYDNGVIYYYTDADEIFMHSSSGSFFQYLSSLSNIDAVAEWNTSNVTGLSNFLSGTAVRNVDALSGWDTSKVTNMSWLLSSTDYLENVDGLSRWNTEKNTSLQGLFRSSLVTNVDGISGWDTSKVTDMHMLLFDATNMQNLDAFSEWNVSSVKDLSNAFQNMTNLTDIKGLKKWKTGNVTDMTSTFAYSKAIQNLSGLEDWDVSNVKALSNLFNSGTWTNVDALSKWKLLSATNVWDMFSNTNIQNVDGLADWEFPSLTSLNGVFSGAWKLTDIDGLADWDVSNITNFSNMFYGTDISDVDALSEWVTSSAENMSDMFWQADKLSDINGLAGWDVSKVTDFDLMFKQTTIADVSALSGWNTESATNMHSMFASTRIASVAPLSGWDVSNVTDMSYMFSGGKFSDLNGLSEWTTSSVTDMESMFYGNLSLEDISGIGGWDVSSVTDVSKMFYGDRYITSLSPLNNWTTTSLTTMTDAFMNIPTSVARPNWYTVGD